MSAALPESASSGGFRRDSSINAPTKELVLRFQVLIDSVSKNELKSEWGLSFSIEYGGRNFLLDMGASGKYADNAAALGVKLSEVDYAVLSHAHYDHAGGIARFFAENKTAPLYVSRNAAENCYHRYSFFWKKYIGIHKGWLKKFSDRIVFAGRKTELCPGAYVVGHEDEADAETKKTAVRNGLCVKENGRLVPDSFRHEQSIVFETERGIVIFSSCSHIGADRIISEVGSAFPGKKICAIAGGFHLFRLDEDSVRQFARRVAETGIKTIITGHCTGRRAYEILRDSLRNDAVSVEQMYSGMTVEL